MSKGSQRNKPCPCGSGKKYKSCCMNRKPAFETVTVDFGVETTITGARVSKDGKLTLYGSDGVAVPLKAWRSLQRERPKGEKVLSKIPVSPDDANLLEGRALSKFDYVFAIDTNTEQIAGNIVSVACVAQLNLERMAADGHGHIRVLGGFEFHGVAEKQENFSWYLLQQSIVSGHKNSSRKRCLIITDSDLGNHTRYNENTMPFFRDVFLAPGIVLSYASEQGRSVSNEMIRLCHNKATAMLKHLRAYPEHLTTATVVNKGPCTRIRGWLNSNPNTGLLEWFQLGPFRL